MDALFDTLLKRTEETTVDPSRSIKPNRPTSSNKRFVIVMAKPKKRNCLKCKAVFNSLGSSNRKCSPCKSREDAYSLPSGWDVSLT